MVVEATVDLHTFKTEIEKQHAFHVFFKIIINVSQINFIRYIRFVTKFYFVSLTVYCETKHFYSYFIYPFLSYKQAITNNFNICICKSVFKLRIARASYFIHIINVFVKFLVCIKLTPAPLNLTICSCHVTYVFESESTLYSCLNVKELLGQFGQMVECLFKN